MSTTVPNTNEIISVIASNPQTYIVMLIQFILGLALGYVAAKAFKYILAMFIIIAIGIFLSVWTLGGTLAQVYETLKPVIDLAKNLATVLGIFSIGPTALGFIIGVLIALFRK